MSQTFGVLGWRALLSSLMLLVLSACGGGGSDYSKTAISLSVQSLEFSVGTGGAPQSQRVTVTYTGDGVLPGFAPKVPIPDWLTIINEDHEDENTVIYEIQVDPSGMSPGSERSSLRFVTGLLPESGDLDDVTDISYVDLPIVVNVVQFEVSPASTYSQLEAGSGATQTDSISVNVPAGTAWTAVSDQPWLTPGSGSGTGSGSLGYTISVGDLAVGSHIGAITVSDGTGLSTKFVVNLWVAQPPFNVSPQSTFVQMAEWSPTPHAGTFTLEAPMTMGWTASSNQPWLTVTPSGTGPGAISYSISTADLTSTYYSPFLSGTVTLAAANGSIASFSVTLMLSTATFYVSGPSTALEMVAGGTTAKTGTATLETLSNRPWTASSNQPWLTVTTPSGTGAAEIGYSVSSAGMSSGYQTALLTVVDTQSLRTTSTSIQVAVNEPRLTVTPAALEIEIGSDVSPAGRTRKLTVSDELGGTVVAKNISWKVTTNNWPYVMPDWLSLSRTAGGSAPAEEVSVVVPSEVLATMTNGTYTYNLTFQYIENNPYGGIVREVQVPVTLRINAPVSKLEVLRQGESFVAIAQGPRVSFRGKATYAHGYSEDLTTQLEWSSSDKAVASFENDAPAPGVVQPLKSGSTQIKAKMVGGTQQGSYELKVDAAKSRVYVVEGDYSGNARVNQYVTGQDGRLQPMRQPRASVGDFPQSLVFTPDGKYAYVSHYQPFEAGQYALSQFSVDADGVLSPLPASRVLLGSYAPQAMIMDKQGKRLYVLGSPYGRILRLDVGADGGLVLDAKPPVDGGGQGGRMALHPTLPYLYQTGYDANMVSRFQVSETGSLTFMPDAQQTGYRPMDVAIHPLGKALYVSNEGDYNNTGALSQYLVDADGQLSYNAAPLELSAKWGGTMAASPNGKYLFLSYSERTSSGHRGDTEVATLELDANGLVSFKFSYLISSLYHLALDSTGTNLYAATGHGTVLQYKVGDDGTLVMDSNIVKLISPRTIVVRPAPAP